MYFNQSPGCFSWLRADLGVGSRVALFWLEECNKSHSENVFGNQEKMLTTTLDVAIKWYNVMINQSWWCQWCQLYKHHHAYWIVFDQRTVDGKEKNNKDFQLCVFSPALLVSCSILLGHLKNFPFCPNVARH